jgi:hypothetical protein
VQPSLRRHLRAPASCAASRRDGRATLLAALTVLASALLLTVAVRAEAANQTLTVLSSSSYLDAAGNLHIVGEIRNPSASTLGEPAITVRATNAAGAVVQTPAALAELDALVPGERSGFALELAASAGAVAGSATGASAPVLPASANTPDRRLVTTVSSSSGSTLTGTVTNTDSSAANDVRVTFTFYDASGRVVDASDVAPGGDPTASIPAGGSVPFTLTRPTGAPSASTVSAIAQAQSEPSLGAAASCPTLAALSTASAAPGTGRYHPLAPTRILDTRVGSGQAQAGHTLCGNSSVEFQVAGVGGIPASGVSAVFLNVTGVSNTAQGTAVTAYPSGSAAPTASSLNLVGTATRAQLVEVPVGAGGRVSLHSSAGNVDLIADVAGYVDSAGASASAGGGAITTVTPTRLADTRAHSGYQRAGTPIGPRGSIPVLVTGRAGVPAGAAVTAVVVNVTAVRPSGSTYLTVTGPAASATSSLSAPPNSDVANRVITPVDPNGAIHIYNNVGTTNVIVDVTGYVTTTGAGSFASVVPARLADTRPGSGFQGAGAPLGGGQTLRVQVAGHGGVPAGARTALITLTVTHTTASSYASAYAAGSPLPAVSDVNWTGAGATVPNLVLVSLSADDGSITIYNRNGNADIVVDVDGYLSTS